MNDKKSLRKKMREMKHTEEVSVLYRTLFSLPEFKTAEAVYLFKSMEGEIDTEPIIHECFRLGKRVLVPVMEAQNELAFYEVKEESLFLLNGFGIMEPIERVKQGDVERRILLTPALAYDINRNRLGKGLGCYDRFLSKHTFSSIIGLAREGEVLEDVYSEEHDIKVDIIITQKGVIK